MTFNINNMQTIKSITLNTVSKTWDLAFETVNNAVVATLTETASTAQGFKLVSDNQSIVLFNNGTYK